MFETYNFKKVTPDIISKKTEELITQQRAIYDRIAEIPLENISYGKVIKEIADADHERCVLGGPLYFAQHASTDKAIRDASCKAETKLEEFDVEISMRKDVFDRVVAFNEKFGSEGLENEPRRFIEKLICMGKRNGLHLPEETRDKIKDLKTRMSELSIKFNNHLNEDNTKLLFTKEELEGMPEDFINALDQVNGKLEVTLKYPHLFPMTKKCRNPETRRIMITASQAKCMKENTPILEELVQMRQKQADLLGYPNHASYIHEERMAKSPDKVAAFLSDLAPKLDTLWQKELKTLRKLKEEECKKYGVEDSGKIEFWDIRYYCNLVEETVYAVNEEEIRQYFPIEKVTSGLFKIYEILLGVEFHIEPEVQAWHEDVLTYRTTDAKTKDVLGYFFLDLHPREGKYGHAAVFPLNPSCVDSKGENQPSLAAMMCNFTKPTNDKPALLTHSEVNTFFHEFGHAMHNVCSQTQFSMFANLRVERDFVEAPSQMLENWVWEKESLRMMSAHVKTGEPLPDNLIEELAASKKANAGGLNLRQIVLATFDQKIHTRGEADTEKLFAETYNEVMAVQTIPNTNMPASFGHLAGGYDAQYYGYLWSEVYAMDMFESRFKVEGLLNPEVGDEYRKCILQPGASMDAMDMLKNFLGREPNNEAFLKSKGLAIEA